MCGICGAWFPSADRTRDELLGLVRPMALALRHRGPDAGGEWVDHKAGIALGHRRLSIVDLSAEGAQPMGSSTGRYVLSFNGEIYNHGRIREELGRIGMAPRWRGHSDTETMLAAFEAWGLRGALDRFVGMFAFALWDVRERCLHLAVDRMGEKPLYYGRVGGGWAFGSELKALRAHAGWCQNIDRGAVALLMRFNYIPAPHSIYAGIRKLPPGTVLTLSGKEDAEPGEYWSVRSAVLAGSAARFAGDDRDAIDSLDRLLRQAISGQMAADVPLGAFLSGGIDSSTVVAVMQALSTRPVKTFSIGFDSAGHDESASARAVARHLGTDHSELRLGWGDALAVIPTIPTLYDEPFSDSSQIPTYLVSRMARREVTVSLSGDGGDELFGGYNRHSWGGAIWRRVGWMPVSLRRRMARALTAVSPEGWEGAFRSLDQVLPGRLRVRNPGEKVHKLAENLAVANPVGMYRGFVSHWQNPEVLVPGSREPVTFLDGNESWPEFANLAEQMMYLDMIGYLPGDILVKVDRAGMGVSLESRIPFLDHRLVEFAWSLPLHLKIRDGEGKWILRRVLERYVPRDLVDRPKMGFAVPLADWLRGPLRDWVETLLAPGRLAEGGFFAPALIRLRWDEHLSGQRDWAYPLWDVLMFQAWKESQ